MKMQTKVTEFLDSKKIQYRILPHEKEVFTCEDAAKERAITIDEMIKTLFLIDKNGKQILAGIIADKKLDLDKLREVASAQKLRFATKDEIKEILGYTMGAVPPIVFDSNTTVVFDEEIKSKEKVSISSGDLMAGIELKAKDLIELVKPKIGKIAK